MTQDLVSFRCLACESEIRLFNSYEDVKQHAEQCHAVISEDVLQSATLLPQILTFQR